MRSAIAASGKCACIVRFDGDAFAQEALALGVVSGLDGGKRMLDRRDRSVPDRRQFGACLGFGPAQPSQRLGRKAMRVGIAGIDLYHHTGLFKRGGGSGPSSASHSQGRARSGVGRCRHRASFLPVPGIGGTPKRNGPDFSGP